MESIMPDDSFKEFVLDRLSSISELRAKAMFGGYGLYQGDLFFGILYEGQLYFKTETSTASDYLARGMKPFTYEIKGRTVTMGYHEVPPDILENAVELSEWAAGAISVAAKSPRKKK